MSAARTTAASIPALWLRRYAAQDVASKLALVVWAWLAAGAGGGVDALAAGGSAVEAVVFYAVTFFRLRREGSARRPLGATALDLVREYGPSELLDLALRPWAMRAALIGAATEAQGLLVGSLVADVAFYAIAIAARRHAERSAA